ncbi:MAG: helix-turn-helix domain-containing protein [Paracoccus sp. (in: a-proteobacteria)]|uniref:TetR/AcrR family transcriptional regulator n=1 Tax=Paracoccus sp. TaxID=267 RepID=UPI0026E0F270|nr:TetR/AcrR family transcriptional regulator [Paracoccus sp. (in: a-proteobacteria)]MDO5631704.1 helix-turn-helix domain-containing protein [Paracoccus sp. (in: a-proteobacteria)]
MTKTSRETLIALARDIFRDHGYAGFSMGDLAAQAGLRKASLYSRFSGKDELAVAALGLTLTQLQALTVTGDDLPARYRALLDGIAGHLTAGRRCVGLHLLYGDVPPPVADANRQFFNGLLTLCTDLLAQALPADLARSMAQDSIAALQGATVWLLLENDAAPMGRAIDALMVTVETLTGDDPQAAEIAALNDQVLPLRTALAGQIKAEAGSR